MLKHSIKRIWRTVTTKQQRDALSIYRTAKRWFPLKDIIFNFKIYHDVHPGTALSATVYKKMFLKADVNYCYGYLYTFDPHLYRKPQGVDSLASITPNYDIIIKSNLDNILTRLPKKDINNKDFIESIYGIIDAIKAKAAKMKISSAADERQRKLFDLFPEILYRDCYTLDEAIQKLLFYNGLMWQAKHWHNGLGRLDYILYPYFMKDLESGIETYESAKQKIKNLCLLLGSQTKFKSLNLIGDTGQYILLGGIDENGENVDNAITHIFLEVMTEIRVPDPKLIFRVNDKTPNDTWNKCIKCLSNGCGSPLFMNETLIMNNMVKFGYAKDDVWNVGTSACWEPLIIGKSSCQNNPFKSIIACDALTNALNSRKTYDTFEDFLVDVKQHLADSAPKVVHDLKCDYSPLMSLFDGDCLRNGRDFAHHGTKYMFHGTQVLSLPNLVNSLFNIQEYVFNKRLISLEDCRNIVNNNYVGYDDVKQLFSGANDKKFGSSSKEVIQLTNELVECISKSLENVTSNGNHVKFGLSSPAYMDMARNKPASLDGRKYGEPYAVHISPISSSVDINEVLEFAGNLSYPPNCLNGNVVDFIIPTAYQKQPEKLVAIINNGFANGLFQLQLNVLDKYTLIDAKKYPEKYPNLVVRVWGFSAYFNDLPEEYKDNLIARADIYESA